ncbi:Uncharacterized protein Adt_01693 [Abeliophyllum distichum]|uniref:Reverse transcriptase domain-containing protein n=1 Tax=Abeliophyllum distichum TaxID=126358 RepID=A0ABD1VTT6_9LAMI
MTALWEKIFRLKQGLRWWNRHVFGDIFQRVRDAECRVDEAESVYDSDPTPAHRDTLHQAQAGLNQTLSVEEAFWKQKAGARWVCEGDHNTQSFCQLLLSLSTLFDPDIIPRLVFDEDNLQLNRIPTLAEVREAIFSIDPDSVAGPDGFSSHFFQECWDIISDDVFQAVLDFFAGGHFPRGFSATSIVLIPKRDNACRWSEFRPISLCTVFNKLVTKLLNSRLSNILPQIISAPQSGFIPGRLIGDNILLAQELLHTLDTKVRGGYAILKLDMAKAYDRLDWGFLISVLEGFGFDAIWIDRIQRCISECHFSVLLNGRPCGFFPSSRGLRQGDPISPSLFILAADYFSRILTRQYQQIASMAYRHGGDALISHLCFADDMIIFANGQKQSIRRVLHCIEHYERASGQLVNRDKSGIILPRRATIQQIHRLEHLTGFRHQQQPVTYLGVPLFKGHRKIFLYDDLIQKVRSRISGWASRLLSPGGRITLIRYGGYSDLRDLFGLSFYGVSTVRAHILILATVPYYASPVWRRLKLIGPQAESYIAWKLGRGHIFFWHDCWMGDTTLADQFSAATTFFHPGSTIQAIYRMIWSSIIPTTVSFFCWRLWQGLIPVDVVIQRRIGSHMASRCQCYSAIETIQHLFIDSSTADTVWRHFADIFHITLRPLEGFQYRFQTWRFSGQFVSTGHIRTIIPLLILWFLWTARNDAKHRDIAMEPRRIIWRVYHTISLLHTGRLFRHIHWRGDMDIAPLFGVIITTPSPPPPTLVFWRTPPVGSYKINTDGCVKDGVASGGGIIRDSSG